MSEQTEQDNIWRHYQNNARDVFDLSYSRLRFLAERCVYKTRVLNIGVGSGYLEKLLAARGVEVYSLDPCAASIARLRIELSMGERAQQGHSSNLSVFKDEYFDKVIMTEVLEHLSGEILHSTLDEVRRSLKPGGEFTGTVPYREDLKSNEVICPNCQAQFHRWGHHQSFDVASLGQVLKQHGFIVEHLYTRSFPDFRRAGLKLFAKSIFRYILGRMGEQLIGPHLYFIAKRGDGGQRSCGDGEDALYPKL